jgi:hypothetical protein
MPEQTIHKIMTATEPADVATMAMIEAMRQIADTGKATNRILEAVQSEVKDVRERVIRIEATEFKAELNATRGEIDRLREGEISRLDTRVSALEMHKAEQTGGIKTASAIKDYGPILLAIVGAVVFALLATGKVPM